MKKNLPRPGFEILFSLGIVLMLLLPPLVMAQQPKALKVTIVNGDTIINDKNLSATEGKKEQFLHRYSLKRDTGITAGLGKYVHTYSLFADDEGSGPRTRRIDGRNTQSFGYSNSNKDGISTHVSYQVGDVEKQTAQKITGLQKPDLDIEDLVITPQFSTGKTSISFTLAAKGYSEVQFKDSDGKTLWTDKANKSFNKSFDLPQNGIYYLQIKQGTKLGLRRIVKEQ